MVYQFKFYNGVRHPLDDYTGNINDIDGLSAFVEGLRFLGDLVIWNADLYYSKEENLFLWVQHQGSAEGLSGFFMYDLEKSFEDNMRATGKEADSKTVEQSATECDTEAQQTENEA